MHSINHLENPIHSADKKAFSVNARVRAALRFVFTIISSSFIVYQLRFDASIQFCRLILRAYNDGALRRSEIGTFSETVMAAVGKTHGTFLFFFLL